MRGSAPSLIVRSATYQNLKRKGRIREFISMFRRDLVKQQRSKNLTMSGRTQQRQGRQGPRQTLGQFSRSICSRAPTIGRRGQIQSVSSPRSRGTFSFPPNHYPIKIPPNLFLEVVVQPTRTPSAKRAPPSCGCKRVW